MTLRVAQASGAQRAARLGQVAEIRAWAGDRRKRGVEGMLRAQAHHLPLPPSLSDALLAPAGPRSFVIDVPYGCVSSRELGALLGETLAEGAAAVSVDIPAANREAGYQWVLELAQRTDRPILCRDLVCDPLQIVMARASGAAAVTLWPTLLEPREVVALHLLAVELGLKTWLRVGSPEDVDASIRIFAQTRDAVPPSVACVEVDGAEQARRLVERLGHDADPRLIVAAALAEAELLSEDAPSRFDDGNVWLVTEVRDPRAAARRMAGLGGV